tara:strand:+ start:2642 stop:2911 length:270 start_codon:yes stop_codon:yes gene_type:complete
MTDLSTKDLISLPEEMAKDPLVRKIAERMINRSNMGIKKYGNTMQTANIGLISGIENTIEELLDAAVYLEDVKIKLSDDADKVRLLLDD